MKFSMQATPDIDVMRQTYSQVGVARLGEFFAEDDVNTFLRSFAQVPDWSMWYMIGDAENSLTSDKVMAMSPDERDALSNEIYRHAATQPGYVHQRVPVDAIAADLAGGSHEMFDMRDFLRGDVFRELIADVTGMDNPQPPTVDVYTYSQSQFLNMNIGSVGVAERRVGYELTLSGNWRPDYGGYLVFFDKQGNYAPGLGPAFNSLTIWDASKLYSITPVAPYSPMTRVSVSGWFMADD